ncbi:Ribosome assembly factor mrt4 [Neolecta irregularis DAH-3]|uniref:Ribosome assembly factor mrt4 n=1 Tax=Neolecta irregularis (strain DAH-3) TaxID=1198029 RepID=A0A1U7LKL9_NEOID|nr:Ribosome assembly factor mrt4 [Neolecta irregularis DAH-3]|eukprot:OLL23143.1 Ribosome assembly factor mrt4 [Neolecta irregularis DAH-3]
MQCWVFSVDNMRNNTLKEIRMEWKDSRIFFGRTKVMAKALGTTPQDEVKNNLLVGDVGLLLTSRSPQTVIDWFDSFVRTDFARAGIISPRTIIVGKGPLYLQGGQVLSEEDALVSPQMEPTFRKLGMTTALEKGVVTLLEDFIVCTEGKPLDSNQTQLLKLFGIALAQFKLRLTGYWEKSSQKVTFVEKEQPDIMES